MNDIGMVKLWPEIEIKKKKIQSIMFSLCLSGKGPKGWLRLFLWEERGKRKEEEQKHGKPHCVTAIPVKQ